MEDKEPKVGIPFLFSDKENHLKWIGYRIDEEYWKEKSVSVPKAKPSMNNYQKEYPIEEMVIQFNWTYDIPDKYKEYIPVLCTVIEIARWKIKFDK